MKFFLIILLAPALLLAQSVPFVSARFPTKTVQVSTASSAPSTVNNWKNTTSGATSLNVTVAVTAGHACIVGFVIYGSSATVTDNLGSTYTVVPSYTAFGQTIGFAIAGNVGSGLVTVTITPNASNMIQAFVYDVANVSAYTTGETAQNFFAGATVWSSGSVTTATANSILFYIASAGGTGSDSTTFSTYTNGFASYGANSTYGTGSSNNATAISYRIVSATGSFTTDVTESGSATNGNNIIAAFH